MTSRLFPPHAREQPAPLVPLTEAQRQFATDHHDLIYAFLHQKGLSVGDYYDAAALGFLQAVQRYLTQPWLRRYAFPTIAWRAMGRDIGMDCRAELRRKNAERQYLEQRRTWPSDIRDEAESRLILHEAFSAASPEQHRLAGLRVQGYSVKEAARIQGMQVKQARSLWAWRPEAACVLISWSPSRSGDGLPVSILLCTSFTALLSIFDISSKPSGVWAEKKRE